MRNFLIYKRCYDMSSNHLVRTVTTAAISVKTEFQTDLTNEMKHIIEHHWREKINNRLFNNNNLQDKTYILSMFPYPSGQLHMGHVRVYAISDAIARFHRMNGQNVLHPMGWDAFGLPAENAAIQRKIPANVWTKSNIKLMKEQLEQLGCSFDWNREFATCDPSYYKWTQLLFLKLYKAGLVYQREALVNWDPIDKTVLADEQVDLNGCSWRSGAKVEKKFLNQWFVKTTKFAKQLLDGLVDSNLKDWKDIIKLQRHWIGDCNGFSFDLEAKFTNGKSRTITVWTEKPEDMIYAEFVIIKSDHMINENNDSGILDSTVYNPLTKCNLPIVVNDTTDFPPFCNIKLAVPRYNNEDLNIAKLHELPIKQFLDNKNEEDVREEVLKRSLELNIGGYLVSSKLRDWLISRQRHWGTPIPIIHCNKCGAVPVKEKDLPILLSPEHVDSNSQVTCPKCGDTNVQLESDTMDTFVDSSWYYLRFIDSENENNMFDIDLSKKIMPVDIYIGGKEHAVLHLYYARFINYFLHSLGLVPQKEPFKRLLVQGMVMGKSFRLKESQKYIPESEVQIIDEKKNKAVEKSSGRPVIMNWEKMSKSKLNGVDPKEVIENFGSDTTRLIILADVAPTSHRNWSPATFPGILNWQKRLWLTLNEFYNARSEITTNTNIVDKNFEELDNKLYDARNYFTGGATFNYKYSHQLSVAISKMQGLTNSLRRSSKSVMQFGKNYERALAAQIIMLSPMAPHFASELWAKFTMTPNRININIDEINWECDVLEQKWPTVDFEFNLDLTIKINGFENCIIKMPRMKLDELTHDEAMNMGLNQKSVTDYLANKTIRNHNFILYPGCEAILSIFLEKPLKLKESVI